MVGKQADNRRSRGISAVPHLDAALPACRRLEQQLARLHRSDAPDPTASRGVTARHHFDLQLSLLRIENRHRAEGTDGRAAALVEFGLLAVGPDRWLIHSEVVPGCARSTSVSAARDNSAR